MRYGTPSRPAHRATADGGLVLLVRGFGSGGQHRPAAPTQPRALHPWSPVRERTGRHESAGRRRAVEPQLAGQWLTQALAGVILLGLATMIGFMVFSPDRYQEAGTPLAPDIGPGAGQAGAPSLSLADVFPDGDELRPAGATGAYRIDLQHVDADCRQAAAGRLGAVLVQHGCGEVVRAGLTAPYGGYQVTAGVFALADASAAAEVDDLLREMVESGSGGFATLPSDSGDPATAQVGWHTRESFLTYCVITRPDGAPVAGDDPYARRITTELVDNHLGESVLGDRAAPPQPPGVLAADRV